MLAQRKGVPRRRLEAGSACTRRAFHQRLDGAVVKAPGFGDRRKAMLEDVAILPHFIAALEGARGQRTGRGLGFPSLPARYG